MTCRPQASVRRRAGILLLIVQGLLVATVVDAQAPVRVRVTRPTVVMEWPRGDSVVLGRVAPGTVLEWLQRSGRWIEVTTAQGTTGVSWKRGWIQEEDVEYPDGRPPGAGTGTTRRGARTPRPRDAGFMVRGFGQFGGTLFAARDSFDAVLDTTLGQSYGAGAQVVLPSGLFVQGTVDRFDETGSRLIVSDAQVFRTGVPNTVTHTPILGTVGYRDPRAGRITGFAGAGVGWHVLEEDSPALADTGKYREGHLGYHLSGGAEFGLLPFLWLAGEVQWASVPGALGDAGIGATFDEKDLGGTTFRVKVIVGR